MKVLLLYPPLTLHIKDVSPPSKSTLVGLGYLGSVVRDQGHEVRILDCLTSSYDSHRLNDSFLRYGLLDDQIGDYLKSYTPDIVGVSAMFTPYLQDAHNVARIVKAWNQNCPVIFGGAHTSTFPDSVMKDANVDVAVIGEGEETLKELLLRYVARNPLKGIRGLMHRVGGAIVKERPREFIRDLDTVAFPAWELLEGDLAVIKQEQQKNRFLMRKPIGYILTSRGCPNDCYFCSVKLVWDRGWRPRSAVNVVNEIEFLKRRYGYEEFHFVDDNSSVSKSRMHEICDEILKRKLKIKLATPTGIAIATLDEEILRKMKRAGFYRLCFGLESGHPETQQIIKKRINLAKARDVTAAANRLGFWTSATFIFGFPHEQREHIQATINFAKMINLDFALFYLLTPQPGTEPYKILKQQGLIDLDQYIDPFSKEWYKISITYSNGFKTVNFSNAQLQGIVSQAYNDFLFYKLRSPRTYVNVVKKIRSIEDFKYLLGLSAVPVSMLLRALTGGRLSNISVRDKNKELKKST